MHTLSRTAYLVVLLLLTACSSPPSPQADKVARLKAEWIASKTLAAQINWDHLKREEEARKLAEVVERNAAIEKELDSKLDKIARQTEELRRAYLETQKALEESKKLADSRTQPPSPAADQPQTTERQGASESPSLAFDPSPALPSWTARQAASPPALRTASPYRPGVAENGSYFGQLNANGIPKTVAVSGYYRKDGTYVRGYYRASSRR